MNKKKKNIKMIFKNSYKNNPLNNKDKLSK